jgi:hypothetical protein
VRRLSTLPLFFVETRSPVSQGVEKLMSTVLDPSSSVPGAVVERRKDIRNIAIMLTLTMARRHWSTA